jgi:CPA2 family monovalent cation:H+ antiporter-2
LNFFERKGKFHEIESRGEDSLEDHVVLVGANRVGGPIVEHHKKHGIPMIVLDFNPKIIEELKKMGIPAMYGDIADSEITESLNLDKAKLLFSTATDIEDNKILLSEIKRINSPVKVMVRVVSDEEIKEMKKRGADYVLMPEDVSADFIVEEMKKTWPKIEFSKL